MLRRPCGPRPGDGRPARRFGDLEIDPAAREAVVAGAPADLTKLEFDLLEALSSRPRAVFTRRQLVDRVWGQDWSVMSTAASDGPGTGACFTIRLPRRAR